MPADPGPFRLDELRALDDWLLANGAPRGYTVDYPKTTEPIHRAVTRVNLLRTFADEQAAARNRRHADDQGGGGE